MRSKLRAKYDQIIDQLPGVRKQVKQPGVKQSEQYYMVVVDPEVYGATRDEIYERLKKRQIFSRRYFWPICTDFDCYKGEIIHTIHDEPVSTKIKDRVLCLPFHSGVTTEHIEIISEVMSNLADRDPNFAIGTSPPACTSVTRR
jgi:dTDP-4-amino-4,6-dideoxygalactose transaminase